MLPRTCLLTMLRNDTCWLFCFLILSSIFAPFYSILSTLLSNYKLHIVRLSLPPAEDMSLKSTVRFFFHLPETTWGRTKPRRPTLVSSSSHTVNKTHFTCLNPRSLVDVFQQQHPYPALFADGRSNCFSQRGHLLHPQLVRRLKPNVTEAVITSGMSTAKPRRNVTDQCLSLD